jgi:hypothetical protein
MLFINKVINKYKVKADIIDLKPRLKEKKLLDQEAEIQPKFDEATLTITTSNTYAYEYELRIKVPVPAAFIRNKKKDNMGTFVQNLHSFVVNTLGMRLGTPTIGGHTSRASKGMLNLEATWYTNDAFLAYALGLDLTQTWGSAPVVDKTQIMTRMHKAEKAYKEMAAYKATTTKKLQLRTQDEAERTKIWQADYMKEFVAMVERYEKLGISYSKLANCYNNQEHHAALGSATALEDSVMGMMECKDFLKSLPDMIVAAKAAVQLGHIQSKPDMVHFNEMILDYLLAVHRKNKDDAIKAAEKLIAEGHGDAFGL